MKKELIDFILKKNFPCVMAKAVARTGMMKFLQVNDIHQELGRILVEFYEFIEKYRERPDRLSSFIICLEEKSSFSQFEEIFWSFLHDLNARDKKLHRHDPRVSADPYSPDFSFSVKEEAFFILALHPDSPRMARRFLKPLIVFNPHQQFETLRSKGLYRKIRDMIRKKDKLLQGEINPMLKDFGESSEIYQYTGRIYEHNAILPI